MPDFLWDHVILIAGVLMVASICYWERASDRRPQTQPAARGRAR